MYQVYVDGSTRGVGVGAGIALVDRNNTTEVVSKNCVMKKPDSVIAEYFALLEALKIIKYRQIDKAIIYFDNDHFFSMFELVEGVFYLKKPSSSVKDDYRFLVESIHELLYEVAKLKKGKIFIKKPTGKTEDEVFYHNVAHYESRRYLGSMDEIYLNDSGILFKCSKESKGSINDYSKRVETLQEVFNK